MNDASKDELDLFKAAILRVRAKQSLEELGNTMIATRGTNRGYSRRVKELQEIPDRLDRALGYTQAEDTQKLIDKVRKAGKKNG